MTNIGILLSGGVGSRFGGSRPKQYLETGGRPVIAWSAAAFDCHPAVGGLVITAASEWRGYISEKVRTDKPLLFADPGATRQLSILSALHVAEARWGRDVAVIVHDAARPFVSQQLITACADGIAEGFDGVLPVLPVKDTIYQSADGVNISGLLPRAELFAGQAPESFRLGRYLDAHKRLGHERLLKVNGSTEVAHLDGMRMKLTQGDERNFKITTPADFLRFEELAGQSAKQ